jgi:hypothetical protein
MKIILRRDEDLDGFSMAGIKAYFTSGENQYEPEMMGGKNMTYVSPDQLTIVAVTDRDLTIRGDGDVDPRLIKIVGSYFRPDKIEGASEEQEKIIKDRVSELENLSEVPEDFK